MTGNGESGMGRIRDHLRTYIGSRPMLEAAIRGVQYPDTVRILLDTVRILFCS